VVSIHFTQACVSVYPMQSDSDQLVVRGLAIGLSRYYDATNELGAMKVLRMRKVQ
jgi:hypothetical protein